MESFAEGYQVRCVHRDEEGDEGRDYVSSHPMGDVLHRGLLGRRDRASYPARAGERPPV